MQRRPIRARGSSRPRPIGGAGRPVPARRPPPGRHRRSERVRHACITPAKAALMRRLPTPSGHGLDRCDEHRCRDGRSCGTCRGWRRPDSAAQHRRGSARAKACSTAASSVAQRSNATPAEATAASIGAASRPIVSTKRAWRANGSASGLKSCPLPSPPRMTTSLGRRAAQRPRPSSAATVAPTFVPLLSSKASTPSMLATSSTRCGSPR